MRIEADLMKTEMKDYFEKLQNKQVSLEGAKEMMENFSKKFQEKKKKLAKISSSTPASPEKPLAKSGHTQKAKKPKAEKAYEPMSEEEIQRKLYDLVRKQSEELMQVIEQEEVKEQQRDEVLKNSEPSTQESLEEEYGIERGKASQRIQKMAKKHEKKVAELEKKLRGLSR